MFIQLKLYYCIQLENILSHLTMIVILKPSIIALVSLFLGTPLHIMSTGDTQNVTAALSLSKLTIDIVHTVT